MRRNFYVDDVLKSVLNEDSAIRLAEQLIQLMKEGFHLTKFWSNSRKLLSILPEEEQANPALNLDLDQLPIGRALGLHWDADSDTLLFKAVPTNKPLTKRGILSTVSTLRSAWVCESFHSSSKGSTSRTMENGNPVG